MMSPRWSRSSDDLDPAVMIQIEWWSRSSDDDLVMIQIQWWWSKSSDDLDPVMMIQIEWWSRSRWRWLEDEDDLKLKMTWRWRGINYDPDDTDKKTCADILCRENNFLVKRECWYNCNFRMYSLLFLIYCNPMFIPRFYCVMSWLDVQIEKIYNVNNSCQVIVGNPPIV